MAETTNIEWTDATVNFWHGCKKVSPGCKHCYMFRDKAKYGQDPEKIVKASQQIWRLPFRIKKPSIMFVCSWSDFFIDKADQWRTAAWNVIKMNPHHIFQILTKRPERIHQCLPKDWGDGYENVWFGISIESTNFNAMRMASLQGVKAKKKFISFEPLLGDVFAPSLDGIDWVIVGGESGNNTGKYLYRECKIEWIRKIVTAAKDKGISVFVKQMGTHLAKEMGLKDRHGRDVSEFPEDLQLREMPI